MMDSGYESDDEPISTDMLEDIYEGSKSHMSVNRREARYIVHVIIKRRQMEWKGVLLPMKNIGKGL